MSSQPMQSDWRSKAFTICLAVVGLALIGCITYNTIHLVSGVKVPFAMSDAAAKWNLKEILGVFRDARDRHDEPITLVAQLGKIYAEMLRMKAALDSGMTVPVIAKTFGMNEYRAKLVAESVKNVPISAIENAVLMTYETDVKLKSTQTDKWVLLDELAAKIYTPRSLREQYA